MAESTSNKGPQRRSFGLESRGKRNVRRPGAVTGLEFDGNAVRAAQVGSRGANTAVTRVVHAPLAAAADLKVSDPSAMGMALAEVVERQRLRGLPVVLGVPRQLVILRTLQVPAVEDIRELASIVYLQIGRELPFRAEDAVIDFKVHVSAPDGHSTEESSAPDAKSSTDASGSSNTPGPKVEVLVAAIRRETVHYFQKVAEAAKLKLIGLGWLSEANARAAAACGWLKEPGTVALVTLRSEDVGVDIMSEGSLVFSRGTALKAQSEPTPGESPVDKEESTGQAVFIEVVRSLLSYGGMESHPQVERLLIAGATGQEAGLQAALHERFKIPCILVEPAKALELSDVPAPEAAEALAVIGLGLGINDPEGLPFDFLHPKRPAVQRNMRRIWTLAACAVGVLFLIGFVGLRTRLLNQRMKVYRDMQTELAKAEKQLPMFRRMQLQAATVQTWNKEGRNWLEQFAYLSALLPGSEDLYITSFNVSGQGNVHMAVQARSGEILAKLERQLHEAGYDVKPLAITPANEKHGYNFRSTVELIVPAKMKVDLSKAQPAARPADDGSLELKTRKGSGRS